MLHSCDNPPCVRPEHLKVGTQLENMRGASSRGRFHPDPELRQGTKNGNAKLSEAQVLEIRNIYATRDVSMREVGRQFHIDPSTVSDIVKRNIWTHI